MKLYGQSKHWRFAVIFDGWFWCFGARISRNGLFIDIGPITIAVWRQQRAIP